MNTNPVAEAPATGQTSAPARRSPRRRSQALPKDVRKAVKNRKVLALLFYNNRSYDDKAVRRELNSVDRYGKQVFVDAHWIKSVGRYQAITRGANVEQSPTVVVVDRNLKAETLVGYVDAKTIDQAVVDALRASGGSLIKNPYFRQLDAICASADAAGQGAAAAGRGRRRPRLPRRCARDHASTCRRQGHGDQAAQEARALPQGLQAATPMTTASLVGVMAMPRQGEPGRAARSVLREPESQGKRSTRSSSRSTARTA